MSRVLLLILTLVLLAGLTLLWWPPAGDVDAVPELPATSEHLDPRVRELLGLARASVLDDPEDTAGWLRLGQALQANGLLEPARASYRGALERSPGLARAWFHLGQVEATLGSIDAAAAAFDEAAALAPEASAPHWWRGRLDLERGRFETAETAFRHALAIDEDDRAAWIGLARTLLAQDRPAAAAELIERHQLGAADGYADHLLAECYRRLDRPADAAAARLRARDVVPPFTDPWTDELGAFKVGYGDRVARARAQLDAGAIAAATASLEALRIERPENVVVLTNLGQAYRRSGRFEECVAVLEDALSRQSGFFQAHFELAVAWAARSRTTPSPDAARRAEHHARVTLELNPAYAPAHALLGDLATLADAHAQAVEHYRAAERNAPGDARWPARTGIALLRVARWSDAEVALERALAMQPDDTNTIRGLAVALMNQDRLDDAEAALVRADALSPGDPGLAQTRAALDRRRRGGAP